MVSSRKGEMRSFSDVLGNVRLPSTVKEHLKNHHIWSRWLEIVGPELHRVTAPLEIKNHALVISVAHQAWAQQLHFLRPSILAKIRCICPDSKLKDLQFRVGEIVRSEETQTKDSSEGLPSFLGDGTLTERQEMTLRAVEDPDLRMSIRQAMQAEKRRNF
ncbi:MAG: hypothetical protein COV44_02710 [Deltaproteobacteria bacterium CG11_big_fil_rev_8_21_14_0_20_45_16]|nr:MAG: hypothetical protein COV44_02710 [Deltaproteobacteria bacterium CG11_big_fil_rev_8_21_14_0_20_45_16]